MTDPIMSRDQVAAHLGISPESVRSWARRQKPPVRFGYSRADVEAAVARRTGQGRRTDLEKAPAERMAEQFVAGVIEAREAGIAMADQLADLITAIHHQPDKDKP